MTDPQSVRLNDEQSAEMWADIDRRHHERCDCALAGIAKSVVQAKPQAVLVGGSFPVTVADFSATGARLRTPHELGVGDRLEITIETPTQSEPLRRECRVVWAGQTSQEQWSAGVEFITG